MRYGYIGISAISMLTATVFLLGLNFSGAASAQGDRELSEHEELHHSVRLAAGAQINILNVSAAVEVKTGEGDVAELTVMRSAADRADFACHTIEFEQKQNGLLIRGGRNGGCRSDSVEVRNRIQLTIPRESSLAARAVSGGVDITFNRSDLRTVRLDAISGAVVFRFAGDANASMQLSGLSGGFLNRVPNVMVQSGNGPIIRGHVGSGDTRITAMQISGDVLIERVQDGLSASESTQLKTVDKQVESAASAQTAATASALTGQGKSRTADTSGGLGRDRTAAGYRVTKEFHESVPLSPNATIEVTGLSGPIEIQGTDGSVAEITIFRSVDNEGDLAYRRVVVAQTPTGLAVHQTQEASEPSSVNLYNRVLIKTPRQVSVVAKGISGNAQISGIAGSVLVEAVSGSVLAADIDGRVEASAVSGNITVSVSKLDTRGIDLSRVSRNVLLRLPGDLNATLEFEGKVLSEMPSLMLEKSGPSTYKGQIGSGGAPITVSKVTGVIKIETK